MTSPLIQLPDPQLQQLAEGPGHTLKSQWPLVSVDADHGLRYVSELDIRLLSEAGRTPSTLCTHVSGR